MKHIKLFSVFFLLSFFSCSSDKSNFLSKDKCLNVSRFEGGHWSCSRSVIIDSTGFFFNLCEFPSDTTKDLKKISIDDAKMFTFFNNLDTTSLLNLQKCLDTIQKGSANEYVYHFIFNYSGKEKVIDINEIYNTNCENKKVDSLKFYFEELEKKLFFWERK